MFNTLKMSSLLIKNGFLVTKQGVVNTDVFVKNGVIAEFHNERPDRIVDATGLLLLPGFVNAHTHLYSSLARGIQTTYTMHNFYENLKYLWWRLDAALDEESVYYSALIGGIESLKNGVTTIIDHHASYNFIDGSLDVINRALSSIGIRHILCFETSDRLGHKQAALALSENERFIKKTSTSKSGMSAGLLGLHASFTLSDKTLERASEISSDTHTGVHIHLSEDRFDRDFTIANYGVLPVLRLNNFKLLEEPGILVHGIYLSGEEREIILKKHIYLAHNPESNLNNAVGVANVKAIGEAGIKIVLGSDGFSHNILDQMRTGTLVYRWQNSTIQEGYAELFEMLSKNNPQLAGSILGIKIGELKPGYSADIVGYRYTPPTPIDRNNLLGHLFFGIHHTPAELAIVNGKLIMQNSNLLNIDEKEIYKKAQDISGKMWKRFENINLQFKFPYD